MSQPAVLVTTSFDVGLPVEISEQFSGLFRRALPKASVEVTPGAKADTCLMSVEVDIRQEKRFFQVLSLLCQAYHVRLGG